MEAIKEKELIRLNLGGRDKPIPGFKTVDLYDDPNKVDIHSDCAVLPMFKTNSVEEIYASHILEHWPHGQTIRVLTEWCRVLRRGGKAYISVPDFDAAVKLYLITGFTDFTRNLLWGDQGYDLAFHYTGFTFASLAKACMDAGFSDVKRISAMPFNLSDCSTLIDTIIHKPISLSVEATK